MRRTATRPWSALAFVAIIAAVLLGGAPERGLAAGNTITSPDSGGQYTSIALDASGVPVISHYDPASGDLKTVHCGDAACASGNTLASPDTTNNVGRYTSLALDAGGNPVVSYYDASLFDVRVLRCGNAACTAGNTIATPDSSLATSTGLYGSLALDGSGNPVVSYYDATNGMLKLLHCGNAVCSTPPTPTPTPSPTPIAVGGFTTLPDVAQHAGGGSAAPLIALGAFAAMVIAITGGLAWRRRNAG